MAWGEHKEEDFEEIEERKFEEKAETKKNKEKYFSEQLNSSEDVFKKENGGYKTYRKPSEKVFLEDKINRGEASFKEKFWYWVLRNKSISQKPKPLSNLEIQNMKKSRKKVSFGLLTL